MDRLIGWLRERIQEERVRKEEETHRLDAEKDLERRINALPVEEAKRLAETLLTDSERFVCVPLQGPGSDEWRRAAMSLAPLLREFVEIYDSVTPVGGFSHYQFTGELEPTINEQGQEDDRLLVIGHLGHDGDFAVRPGEEAIYYVDGDDPESEFAYTTIYHAILCLDRLREIEPAQE